VNFREGSLVSVEVPGSDAVRRRCLEANILGDTESNFLSGTASPKRLRYLQPFTHIEIFETHLSEYCQRRYLKSAGSAQFNSLRSHNRHPSWENVVRTEDRSSLVPR
jgi:hypothetical protein